MGQESFNEGKLVDIRKNIAEKHNISEEKVADKMNEMLATQDAIMTEIYGSYLKKIEILRLGAFEIGIPKKVADGFVLSIELSIAYNILLRILKNSSRKETTDAVEKALNKLKNMKGACGIDSLSADLTKYDIYKRKFH